MPSEWFDTSASRIRSAFGAHMASAFPDAGIAYDNQDFKPPDPPSEAAIAAGTATEESGAWALLLIDFLDSNQSDMASNPRFRSSGLATVQVLVPAGRGDGLAWRIADSAAAFFRRFRSGGMVFRAPYPSRVGPNEDGWHQVNVIAPFHLDATETA